MQSKRYKKCKPVHLRKVPCTRNEMLKYESQKWLRCPPTCVGQGVAPNSNLPGASLILYLNLLTHTYTHTYSISPTIIYRQTHSISPALIYRRTHSISPALRRTTYRLHSYTDTRTTNYLHSYTDTRTACHLHSYTDTCTLLFMDYLCFYKYAQT